MRDKRRKQEFKNQKSQPNGDFIERNKYMDKLYPQIIFFDENDLGKIVRNAWIEWAKEQPNPKESWLVPYEGLSQPDKDADIRIGKAVLDRCNECIETILNNYKH